MRRFKGGASVALLLFSAGTLYSHYTGSLYPGLPASVAIAATVLFLSVVGSPVRKGTGVAMFVALGVAYRSYGFLFPATLSRFDPNRHAIFSQAIVLTGDLSLIKESGYFYGTAACFPVFGAETALVTDTGIRTAYLVFPIAAAIVAPLFAAVLVGRVYERKYAMVISAAVVSVGATLTGFSVSPVPMTLGALYVGGFGVTAMFAEHRFEPRTIVPLLVFTLLAAYTHKIALLIIAVASTAFFIYSVVSRIEFTRPSSGIESFLLVFTGIALLLQWVYLTNFFVNAVEIVFSVFIEGRAGPPTNPPGAFLVYPPLLVQFLNVSYYPLGLAVGGLAGVELFRRHTDKNTRILQMFAIVTAILTVPGVFVSAAPGFQRVYLYATIFVAALIGIGTSKFRAVDWPPARVVASLVVVLLLVANPMAAVAMPDFPGSARVYLTDDEVTAKGFTDEYVDTVVYRDLFYQYVPADFERTARDPQHRERGIPFHRLEELGYLNRELTHASLSEKDYDYVSLRTDIALYRLLGGTYRLEWSPVDVMNRQESVVYDNERVRVYVGT